ncbi:MAG: homocysteine S-methyltransferase family protein [Coriobacteriales bacterium]
MDGTGSEVLVTEGAMGTMLQKFGLNVNGGAGIYNLTEPQLVCEVHKRYRAAGSQCAITNTFNPCVSEDVADIKTAAEINAAAVRIAREAGYDIVLGDCGPCSLLMEPLGQATFDRVVEVYKRHFSSLAKAGVEAFLLETFIDIADLRAAILAARSVDAGKPVIACCSFKKDNMATFLSSTKPAAFAVIAESLGASMVGLNCGFGPEESEVALEQISSATTLPLIVEPNAGIPDIDDDGTPHYPGTPEQQAAYSKRYADLGARIIGSCCGSDPDFTIAIANAIEGYEPPAVRPHDGCTRLASACDVLVSEDGALDLSGMYVIDVSNGEFDKWDVLENTVCCPFIVEYGSASTPDYANLEEALKVYPGRAVVQMQTVDSLGAETAAYYGSAVVIPMECGSVDAIARCAIDSGIKPRDVLIGIGGPFEPDMDPSAVEMRVWKS